MRLRWIVPVIAGMGLVPVWLCAPPPVRASGPRTVEELIAACRASGARGHDLADVAIAAVAAAYPTYSLWHLAESPQRSLAAHRGWSHQYNTILLLVLRGLGFDARLVHAARVRGFGRPWWLAGHTWVRVRIDESWLDACASDAGATVGSPPFVPLTPVLPLRRVTRWAVGVSLVPFVVVEVWRAWLGGRSVAGWVYGERVEGRAGSRPLG